MLYNKEVPIRNLRGKWQWHSQNAEKVTHIKGTLLYKALILYNYVPFQIELLLKERICSQGKRFFSFKSSFLRYGTLFLPHKVSFLYVTIFITHVGILRNGSYAKEWPTIKTIRLR